jgi:hypothetical protein
MAERQEDGSTCTRRRLRRYRTGGKGHISHLERRYVLRRSRLRADRAQRTWTGWAILATTSTRSHPTRLTPSQALHQSNAP